MIKYIKKFINKLKKKKMKIGDKVTFKKHASKAASGFNYRENDELIITSLLGQINGEKWNIRNTTTGGVGWAYEYELHPLVITKEDFEKQKVELQNSINELNMKLSWMDENGVGEFNEDEFKVFKTLTLLDDDSISKVEKSKLIAQLIKN